MYVTWKIALKNKFVGVLFEKGYGAFKEKKHLSAPRFQNQKGLND